MNNATIIPLIPEKVPGLIQLMTRYPIPSPPVRKLIVFFLLPSLSEMRPPAGRATRLTKAKEEARIPAVAFGKSNVVSKKVGNIETTASSEPKLTIYVSSRMATCLNS